jgi:NAD(P)-dependent dehydrogenase (short-subunit alcohol dehydrogenase family)
MVIAGNASPLRGKHAVIAGAGRGAGPAIAAALLQQGAHVTLLGQDAHRLQQIAMQLAATGVILTTEATQTAPPSRIAVVRGASAIRWLHYDTPDEAGAERLVQQIVAQYGVVDILVHNGGLIEPAPLLDTSLVTWNKLLDANLTQPFMLIKATLPAMLQQGWGRVVTVTDIAASRTRAGYAAYHAARQGLTGLATALAAELGGTGTTVNAVEVVLPDQIQAPSDSALASLQRQLVEAVARLCSPAGDPVHGQIIQVTLPASTTPK